MDSCLYNAAITGKIDVLNQNEDKIGVQLTPDKNTVLHLASQLGQMEAVKLILSIQPSLISQVNSFGETAFHLAARGGHACVVRVLIDCARKLERDIEIGPHAQQLIMWMANNDKETALHMAIRYNQPQVLSMLLKEDMSYSHSANKMGETPLYIAANRGFDVLVDMILENCKTPAYSGPNGTTALHGAVVCGSEECTRKLLEWKESILMETDSNGQTPLHYAAYVGFSSIVCQLLRVDSSAAYVVNKDFSETALHIAAIRGHVSVMKEILLACPDSCSMVNIYGQNMLHLAIENNQKHVVEYIIEECRVISSLINQKDIDGNTPTHLMALSNCYVPKLIQHDMVDKGALNNQNLTTHLGSSVYKNIRNTKAETQIENSHESYESTLVVHKATNNETTLMNKGAAPTPDPIEEVRKFINTDIIVAALIVTVTFAAGFTMPGGYIQSGSENQGMAVLSKYVAFQAFIISDTLALLFSITALLLYGLTAGGVKQDTITKFYTAGGVLTLLALVAMMVAFVTGTYAVLAHSSALAIATCLIGCTFFPIYFIVEVISTP